jgi:mycothiol synthase
MKNATLKLPSGDTLTIRSFAFTDQDYEQFAVMFNADGTLRPMSLRELRRLDANRDSAYFRERVLAEVNGEVVGAGECEEPFWAYRPGKYHLLTFVPGRFDGQGVDEALFDHLVDLAVQRGATSLASVAQESRTSRVRMLTDRGFEPTLREQSSILEPAAFDPTPFEPVLAKVREMGVEIRSVTELEQLGVDWKRRAWELLAELLEDVPSTDRRSCESFAHFEKRVADGDRFTPEAYFLAVHGDRFVGMSNLEPTEADPGTVPTGLTGVVRSYRRKGIATALKVAGILWAKQQGAKAIETGNVESNPMYDLNVKLGFRPTKATLSFRKVLAQPE